MALTVLQYGEPTHFLPVHPIIWVNAMWLICLAPRTICSNILEIRSPPKRGFSITNRIRDTRLQDHGKIVKDSYMNHIGLGYPYVHLA